MSQSNIGVAFDLTWQTQQWQAQADAVMESLQNLQQQASSMSIAIPVIMDDQLTAGVDALIQEIEATRQVVIPVVFGEPGVFPGGGGFGGGFAGGAPPSLGSSIDEDAIGNAAIGAAIFGGGLGGAGFRPEIGYGPRIGSAYANPELSAPFTDYELQEAAAMEAASYPEEAAMAGGAAASLGRAGSWGMRGMGAFSAIFAARQLARLWEENSKENSAINFTETDADPGTSGGESMTTANAKKALRQFQEQNTRIFGSLGSDARNFLGGIGEWLTDGQEARVNVNAFPGGIGRAIASTVFGGTDTEKEQAFRDAIAKSERADQQKKIDTEQIKYDDHFRKVASRIADEPSVGGDRFETDRKRISLKYTDLEDALDEQYNATRKTAEDTKQYNDTHGKLVSDNNAALAQVNDAETFYKSQRAAKSAAESAMLSGDTDSTRKIELGARVHAEEQSLPPDQRQQWFNDIGARTISQGDARIDLQSSISDQESNTRGFNAVRSALDQSKTSGGDADAAYSGRRDELEAQGQQRIQQLRDEATLQKDTAEAKRLNNQADAEQYALGIRLNAMDTERNRQTKDRLTDINSETESTEARAKGQDQRGDLIDLEASITKSIKDAPEAEKSSLRKLGEAQIDHFTHGQSAPFMGSLGQFQDQMQMQILRSDPSVLKDAAAFKTQLQHDDTPKKHSEAADDLKKAAAKLLPAAEAIAKIFVMQTF